MGVTVSVSVADDAEYSVVRDVAVMSDDVVGMATAVVSPGGWVGV